MLIPWFLQSATWSAVTVFPLETMHSPNGSSLLLFVGLKLTRRVTRSSFDSSELCTSLISTIHRLTGGQCAPRDESDHLGHRFLRHCSVGPMRPIITSKLILDISNCWVSCLSLCSISLIVLQLHPGELYILEAGITMPTGLNAENFILTYSNQSIR